MQPDPGDITVTSRHSQLMGVDMQLFEPVVMEIVLHGLLNKGTAAAENINGKSSKVKHDDDGECFNIALR